MYQLIYHLSKNEPSIQGSIKHFHTGPFKSTGFQALTPQQPSWNGSSNAWQQRKPSGEGWIVIITHPDLPSHQQHHCRVPYSCNWSWKPRDKRLNINQSDRQVFFCAPFFFFFSFLSWEHPITLMSEVRKIYLVEIPFVIEDESCSANYFPAAGQLEYSGPPLHLPLSKISPRLKAKQFNRNPMERPLQSSFSGLPSIFTPTGNCKNHKAMLRSIWCQTQVSADFTRALFRSLVLPFLWKHCSSHVAEQCVDELGFQILAEGDHWVSHLRLFPHVVLLRSQC